MAEGKPWDQYTTVPSSTIADDDTFLVGGKTNGVRAVSAQELVDSKQDTLSTDQLSAIADVSKKQDALSDTQLEALNSGITDDKVAKYDGYETDKQEAAYGNAAAHNSIYRGKSLGTSVTSAQWAAIKAGTFEDMYIGDYWTISNVVYRIAAFDYWLNHGDTNCTAHHVVLVPDACMYKTAMNSENTTAGGYVGSAMYTTKLATAKTTVTNAFGSAHILTHREYLTNAVTSSYASAGSWYDSTVELMNEVMVYGTDFFTPHNSLGTAIPNTYTIGTGQLPLFTFDHGCICNRVNWWLRDVVTAATFANVYTYGRCNYYNASDSAGVRPAFGIC